MAERQSPGRSTWASFSQMDELAKEIEGLAFMVNARFVAAQSKDQGREQASERSESPAPWHRATEEKPVTSIHK